MSHHLHQIGLFGLIFAVLLGAGCNRTRLMSSDDFFSQSNAGDPVPPGEQDPPPGKPAAPRVRSQQAEAPAPIRTVAYPEVRNADPVPDKVRIVAWVNGTPIFRGELLNFAAGDLARLKGVVEPEYSTRRREILQKTLQYMIDQEVIYQDAVRKLEKNQRVLDEMKAVAGKELERWLRRNRAQSGLSDFELRQQLQAQGMSMETIKRKFEREIIVGEYLRARLEAIKNSIGHKEIRDYYEQHPNEFQTLDRVDWEDIFIAAGTAKHPTMTEVRAFSRQLAQRLKAGEPFANLLPFDDGDARYRKGKGHGQHRGEIKPAELEPVLFAMKPGEIRMAEIPTGVHIFRLVERDYAGPLPFNSDVQAKIRKKLQDELLHHERQRIVRQIATRMVIEVDPEALK